MDYTMGASALYSSTMRPNQGYKDKESYNTLQKKEARVRVQ